jgi:hypothetical protein
MYETALSGLTPRRFPCAVFWTLGHQYLMLLTPVPAWFVAYNAQLHSEDVTTAFITVLVLLASFNLFCRASAVGCLRCPSRRPRRCRSGYPWR